MKKRIIAFVLSAIMVLSTVYPVQNVWADPDAEPEKQNETQVEVVTEQPGAESNQEQQTQPAPETVAPAPAETQAPVTEPVPTEQQTEVPAPTEKEPEAPAPVETEPEVIQPEVTEPEEPQTEAPVPAETTEAPVPTEEQTEAPAPTEEQTEAPVEPTEPRTEDPTLPDIGAPEIPAESWKELTNAEKDVVVSGVLPVGTVLNGGSIPNPFLMGKNANALKGGRKSTNSSASRGTDGIANWNYIAFYDLKLAADGENVQPDGSVQVTITNAAVKGKNVSILHILDNAEAITKNIANLTKVTDSSFVSAFPTEAAAAKAATGEDGCVYIELLDAEVDGESVSFTTNSFSIYAIIDDDTLLVPRDTYYFLKEENGSYVPFYFINDVGVETDRQILKNGEALQDVGLPDIPAGTSFQGWFLCNQDGSLVQPVEEIVFGEARTVGSTDKTYYVRPVFDSVVYFTFDEKSHGGVVLQQKQVPVGGTFDVNSLSLPTPEATLAFVGWSTEPGADDDERIPIFDDPSTETNEAVITAAENMSFYPVFKAAHWVNFVSSYVGSGATYIPSAYVLVGMTTAIARPANPPIWPGHRFLYWTKENTITQVTDDHGNLVDTMIDFGDNPPARYNFDEELDQDITLYAYWEDSEANFTVIYWAQNITDQKNIVDSAKTYSYFKQVNGRQTIGTDVLALDYSAPTGPEFADLNIGFVFNGDKSDDKVRVSSDGKSTLNLFFDRKIITMVFEGNGTGEYYVVAPDDNGTQYGLVNGQYVELEKTTEQGLTWGFQYTFTVAGDAATYGESQLSDGDFWGMNDKGEYRPLHVKNERHSGFCSGTYYTYTYEMDGVSYDGTKYSRNNNNTYDYQGFRYAKQGDSFVQTDNTTGTLYGVDRNGGFVELRSRAGTVTKWKIKGTNTDYTGQRFVKRTVNGTVFTGLYGQTLEQNGYSWPDGYWRYRNDKGGYTGMSYLGEFILPDGVEDPYRQTIYLEKRNVNTNTIEFYLQNVDGSYAAPPNASDSGTGQQGSDFYFSEKYDGYHVAQFRLYQVGNNGKRTYYDTRGNVVNNPDNAWYTAVVGNFVELRSGYNLEIRYARNYYTLKFLDSANGEEILTSQSIIYGGALKSYYPSATPSSTAPGKEFAGVWFADQACTKGLFFDTPTADQLSKLATHLDKEASALVAGTDYDVMTTMPQADMKIYAGWNDIWYWIKIDPNGGEIASSQATFFWETYGERVEEYANATRDFVESENGAWYYHYDEFNEANPNGTQPATRRAYYTTDASQSTDGKRYERLQSGQAYALIGWYDITNGEENATPYKFDQQITHNLILQARWRRVGEYRVVYDREDANGIAAVGNVPYDSNYYADHSDSAFLGAPAAPEGYVFSGWTYKGEIKNPGDIFVVDADLADENYEIHIVPVFTKIEQVPIHTTKLVYNGNGGTTTEESDPDNLVTVSSDGTTITYEGLEVNAEQTLLGEVFTKIGYELIGWSTDPNATTKEFDLNQTKVGVDNLDTPNSSENTLYAVWRIKKYPVTVKKVVSGDNTDPASTFAFANPAFSSNQYQQTFALADGGSKVFAEVPYGTTFTITEDAQSLFDVTVLERIIEGADPDHTGDETEHSNGYTYTVVGEMEIIVTNTRKTADYKIHYFQEQPDGTFVEAEADVKTKTGNVGDEMELTAEDKKTYDGFVLDESLTAMNPETGLILEDNTSYINLYYKRLVTFTVTKTWNDDSNRDGIRPTSVVFQLKANGTSLGDDYKATVTGNTKTNEGWFKTWENLPLTDANGVIQYSVAEITLPEGYTSVPANAAQDADTGNWTQTVENTHAPETVSVKVVKDWQDNDNQDGIRPANTDLQVVLNTGNSTQTGITKTVNLLANGTYEWTGLYKYEQGVAITYTVSETPKYVTVNGKTVALTIDDPETDPYEGSTGHNSYEISVGANELTDGNFRYTVTNTHVPDTTSVEVTKTWFDDKNRDGIRPATLSFTLTGSDGSSRTISNVAVDADDTGAIHNVKFTGLPVYKNGVEIVYTLTEASVNGYRTVIPTMNGGSEDDPGWARTEGDDGITRYSVNVENTHIPETTSVTVTKVWDDDNDRDGIRPASVTVKLFADGADTNLTVTLTAASNWTGTFEDLLANNAGTPIEYTVQEVMPAEGYQVTRNNEILTVMLTTDKDTGLNYKQTTVTQPAKTVDQNTHAVSWADASITNKHVPETIDVTVTKVWDDDNDRDGIRDEQNPVIKLNGVDSAQTAADWNVPNTNAENGNPVNSFEHTWEGMFKYQNHGQPIQYSVTETGLGNQYTQSTTGNMTDGFEVKNTHTPAKVEVTVTKVWDDNKNQDGKRPDYITVNLLKGNPAAAVDQDGIPASVKIGTAGEGVVIVTPGVDDEGRDTWTYTWSGLYKNERVNGTTSEIVYSVTEDAVAGYEGEVAGWIITNTHEPILTSITVTKVWKDNKNQDGKRPESLDIELYMNGELLKTVTVNPNSDDVTVGTDADGNDTWTYTFTNLEVYHIDNGVVAVLNKYQAKEKTFEHADEYTCGEGNVVTASEADNSGTSTIINSYQTKVTEVPVKKVWNDDNDRDGIRPESITVQLYADGELVKDAQNKPVEITLNEGNNWSGKFTGLDAYKNGQLITYTVKEVYTEVLTESTDSASTYKLDAANTSMGQATVDQTTKEVTWSEAVITNVHTPETVEITITKIWVDNSNSGNTRPEDFLALLHLFANGTEIPQVNMMVVKSETGDTWTYTFKGTAEYPLYKYTAKRQAITYKFEEDEIKKNGTVVYGAAWNPQEIASTDDLSKFKVTNTALEGELVIAKKFTNNATFTDDQSFVFHVTGPSGATTVDRTVVVVVKAGKSYGYVTITQIPIGTYTVTEDDDWSWRWEANATTPWTANNVKDGKPEVLPTQTTTVIFNNDLTDENWLSDTAYARNIFTGASGSTGSALPAPEEPKSVAVVLPAPEVGDDKKKREEA